LRRIARTCPPFTPKAPPSAKCQLWFTKCEEEPLFYSTMYPTPSKTWFAPS
jgi:hypothetical protein